MSVSSNLLAYNILSSAPPYPFKLWHTISIAKLERVGQIKRVVLIYIQCMHAVHACILSHFSSVWILVIPWTVAFQVPLSMGFSRQEYWSGLPCPPPGDLPNPGIEPMSLISLALAGKFFTIEPQGKSTIYTYHCGSAGKESVCNEGDLGLIPGLGRSHGEGKGYSLQYLTWLGRSHGEGKGYPLQYFGRLYTKSRRDWATFIHFTITLYIQYRV